MVQAPTSIDTLYEQARALDSEQRALLAHWLIDSLVEDTMVKDPGYDEYWEAEIRRRVREIDEGRAELIPWEEVRERMLAQVAELKQGQAD